MDFKTSGTRGKKMSTCWADPPGKFWTCIFPNRCGRLTNSKFSWLLVVFDNSRARLYANSGFGWARWQNNMVTTTCIITVYKITAALLGLYLPCIDTGRYYGRNCNTFFMRGSFLLPLCKHHPQVFPSNFIPVPVIVLRTFERNHSVCHNIPDIIRSFFHIDMHHQIWAQKKLGFRSSFGDISKLDHFLYAGGPLQFWHWFVLI